MPNIVGREVEFGLAVESVRGVAESAAAKWFRKVTCTVVERAQHVVDETTRGRLEDGEGRRVVQKWVEGELSGILHADAFAYLLASVYGVVVTSTVSGSVRDHAMSLAQNIQHPSLTLFVKDGSAQQVKVAGCMIGTLEITSAVDDYVRFTATFVGGAATDDSSVPSYDTEYDFISRDIVLKLADSEAGIGAASAVKAKDFSVKWDQGLLRDHVQGSYSPDDTYNGKLMIEGSFTLNFADETMKDLYLGDAAKYLSLVIAGAADIGVGSHPTITALFNKAQLTDWNRDGGASELVTQPVTFRAFYNEDDAEQSTVTVRNLTDAIDSVPSA